MRLTQQYLFKWILMIAVIFPISLFAQEIEINPDEDPNAYDDIIEYYPDVLAEFPGGSIEMMNYLSKNFKYPDVEMTEYPEGNILIEFIVNTDGSLEKFKVLKGVTRTLDEEALRVVKNMPKWIPAEKNGKKVRSRKLLPIGIRH